MYNMNNRRQYNIVICMYICGTQIIEIIFLHNASICWMNYVTCPCELFTTKCHSKRKIVEVTARLKEKKIVFISNTPSLKNLTGIDAHIIMWICSRQICFVFKENSVNWFKKSRTRYHRNNNITSITRHTLGECFFSFLIVSKIDVSPVKWNLIN